MCAEVRWLRTMCSAISCASRPSARSDRLTRPTPGCTGSGPWAPRRANDDRGSRDVLLGHATADTGPGYRRDSMLCSLAIRRTRGDERASERPRGTGPVELVDRVGRWLDGGQVDRVDRVGRVGACRAEAGDAVPDGRDDAVDGDGLAFLQTRISDRTPAAGDGISASTLSVEISNRG